MKNRGFSSRGLPDKSGGTAYFFALALPAATTAAFLRFMYAMRRFFLIPLLYCLPINVC